VSRTFYRIVLTDPPTLSDFLSAQARGRAALEDDPERIRLHQGISVYATAAQAHRKARASPVLGRYVAVLEIPENGPIRWERTTASQGHHTLWGDPATLLRCVVAVVPSTGVP
jgi:hypothetical protein